MPNTDAVIRRLLAAAPRGPYELQVVTRDAMDDARLQPLHAMANAQMAEPYAHFRVHALTNDVLHVFRRRESDAPVGFQFWRMLDGAGGRVILGGKLRILPEARRQGLHLVAGLSVLLSERARVPKQPLTRLGVASLFGFASVARRLAHYDFVTQAVRSDLVDVVQAVTRVSDFHYDPHSGLVDVGIFVTDAQWNAYPAHFFESETARAYLERNPEFRTNGRYLAYAFDVDVANLHALMHGTCRAVLGEGSSAPAFEAELTASL